MSSSLVIQFQGWVIIRIPTDPDPTDEPRGVSGYSFAFAGEPDLDRIIYLQPPPGFTLRSYTPPIGVTVTEATRYDDAGPAQVPALQEATVDLLGGPKLENRNWNLTPAGYEPVVPFNLRIAGKRIVLERSAVLDSEHPNRPVWQIDEPLLLAQGANGVEYEPETIGKATGIWDSLAVAQDRLSRLRDDYERLSHEGGDPVALAALRGRISELEIGVASPGDRRIMARYYVERFNFPLSGRAMVSGSQERLLGGRLATAKDTPWAIGFWFGAWDPDTLSMFMQGALKIPYRASPAAGAA